MSLAATPGTWGRRVACTAHSILGQGRELAIFTSPSTDFKDPAREEVGHPAHPGPEDQAWFSGKRPEEDSGGQEAVGGDGEVSEQISAHPIIKPA